MFLHRQRIISLGKFIYIFYQQMRKLKKIFFFFANPVLSIDLLCQRLMLRRLRLLLDRSFETTSFKGFAGRFLEFFKLLSELADLRFPFRNLTIDLRNLLKQIVLRASELGILLRTRLR